MFLASVLMISVLVVNAPQMSASDRPLSMIEDYSINLRKLGPDHPRLRELRERIIEVADSDFKIDLVEVQQRFEDLELERRELLRTLGLEHPKAVENATRLAVMSRLLAGQASEVLQELSDSAR